MSPVARAPARPVEAGGTARRAPARGRASRISLTLLGGFELTAEGRAVAVPVPAQRLVAFLALLGGPVRRSHVAGTLWLESSGDHAAASLRSALWRARRTGLPLVEATSAQLRLGPTVAVDVREDAAWAERVADPAREPGAADLLRVRTSPELLPDWYDDWVAFEREGFRQRRLHALEALCARLTAAGRYADAIEAGLAAVRAEPLRESAHRVVIGVHLAEGNRVEAVRALEAYRALLARDLGLSPSPDLEGLVSGVTAG